MLERRCPALSSAVWVTVSAGGRRRGNGACGTHAQSTINGIISPVDYSLTTHSLTLYYTHITAGCVLILAALAAHKVISPHFPLQSAETETRPVSETPCFMQSAGTEVTVFGQGYGLLGGSNESASHEFTSPKCVHFPPMRLSGCNGYFPRLYATVARLYNHFYSATVARLCNEPFRAYRQ